MDPYSIFQRFKNSSQAEELASILKANEIEYELIIDSPVFDVTIVGNILQNEIQIKIKQSDFEKATKILEMESEKIINNVSKDYYLFGFSNEELYEILLKPDEWSSFDNKLSLKILKERGQNIDPDLFSALKKQRLEDLAKPEQDQKPWIIAGYLFAILGGLLGIFIGYFLWNFKKTLPNGQKVYAYTESNRKHGRIIFIISIIVFPISFLLRLLADIFRV